MRKRSWFLVGILLSVGCVPTVYRKSVTVTKDPDGKIQKIVVVEEMTQQLRAVATVEGKPVYKYLAQ